MRVSEYLELEDDSELLRRAGGSWAAWTEREPRLAVVAFDGLRDWLDEAAPREADEVLHALATLAASDGGDDVAAAAVLAWVLLPGACRLARELRTLNRDVTMLVAAQLWIEVRSFPWRRLSKVAANIVMNTRAACLREAGAVGQVRRADRVWSASHVVSPDSFFWDHYAAGRRSERAATHDRSSGRQLEPGDEELPKLRAVQVACSPVDSDPAEEMAELLDWACENEVISAADRRLLQVVVEEADEVEIRRTGRSNAGLTAAEISRRVAPRLGLSQATVRRRAARCIRALAAAAERYVA